MSTRIKTRSQHTYAEIANRSKGSVGRGPQTSSQPMPIAQTDSPTLALALALDFQDIGFQFFVGCVNLHPPLEFRDSVCSLLILPLICWCRWVGRFPQLLQFVYEHPSLHQECPDSLSLQSIH